MGKATNSGNVQVICHTEDCIHRKNGFCANEAAITILEGRCIAYEKAIKKYEYSLIAGLPRLLSTVYVSPGGGYFYQARLLGYAAYGKDPTYKTYCVEVTREDGHKFVDFFEDIFSRKLINGGEIDD